MRMNERKSDAEKSNKKRKFVLNGSKPENKQVENGKNRFEVNGIIWENRNFIGQFLTIFYDFFSLDWNQIYRFDQIMRHKTSFDKM